MALCGPLVMEPIIDDNSEKDHLWEYFQKENNLSEKLKSSAGKEFQINYNKHIQIKKKNIANVLYWSIRGQKSKRDFTE